MLLCTYTGLPVVGLCVISHSKEIPRGCSVRCVRGAESQDVDTYVAAVEKQNLFSATPDSPRPQFIVKYFMACSTLGVHTAA